MKHNFGQMPTRLDLEKALDTMCSTVGYKTLGSYPQKLMRVALIIQHRLDRQLTFERPKTNYKYAKSIVFLYEINCFNSAFCIERAMSFRYHQHPNSEFFQGIYGILPLSIPLQANFAVSRKEYPSIIHIKGHPHKKLPYHSCIALGETVDGKDIVIWEKQSNHYPFRVTTLQTVFENYTNCYWAVRPLQTPR